MVRKKQTITLHILLLSLNSQAYFNSLIASISINNNIANNIFKRYRPIVDAQRLLALMYVQQATMIAKTYRYDNSDSVSNVSVTRQGREQ